MMIYQFDVQLKKFNLTQCDDIIIVIHKSHLYRDTDRHVHLTHYSCKNTNTIHHNKTCQEH